MNCIPDKLDKSTTGLESLVSSAPVLKRSPRIKLTFEDTEFLVKIRKEKEEELYWCNTHQRKATHITERGNHKCDPKAGGILLPCEVVNLTGIAELV